LDGPLWSLPASHFVVLPRHRGTAQAILEALLRIQERDPAARIVMLSCEYSVHDSARDESSLIRSLRYVAAHTLLRPDELFLLGLESKTATTGFPGILVGRDDHRGAFEVAGLIDEPSTTSTYAATDRRLLLNTGVLAGSVRALLRLIERHMPGVVARAQTLMRHQPHSGPGSEAAELSSQLNGLDFHRHLLPGHERYLSVIPVPRWNREPASAPVYSFETRASLRSDATPLTLAHETSLTPASPGA
jgi:mannose-1-phosphate guanylyltransferase